MPEPMPWLTAGRQEAYIGNCPMLRPNMGTTSSGLHVACLRFYAIERPAMPGPLPVPGMPADFYGPFAAIALMAGPDCSSCPCMTPNLQNPVLAASRHFLL